MARRVRFEDKEDMSSDEEDQENEFEKEMRQEMELHSANSTQSVCGDSQETEPEDDMFYDPEADDEDQKWVEDRRLEYLSSNGAVPQGSGERKEQMAKCPSSEAVLNCPGCMTVLCLDCQRHEVYKTQYRAMFVLNCDIDFSEKLQMGGKKKKKAQVDDGSYFNVRCAVCKSQVAVVDDEEVFHFFNVLSSYS